jgi:hypothetical protein
LQELITANEPEAQLIGLNTLQNDLLKRKVNKLEFEKFQSLVDRFSSIATEGLIRHHT